MVLSCPACGAPAEGAGPPGAAVICPACEAPFVVAEVAPEEAPLELARPVVARETQAPRCEGCGALRDPAARRCGACQRSWEFRVVAYGPPAPEVAARLIEYVARRSALNARDSVAARFAQWPAVVLDRLTEVQASRIRREVEALEVRAVAEPDPGRAVAPARTASRPPPLLALALSAAAVLAAGIYLFTRPEAGPTRPATEGQARPREVTPPTDSLAGVALVRGRDGVGVGLVVDPAGWVVAPASIARADGRLSLTLPSGEERRATRSRLTEQADLALFKVRGALPIAVSVGDAGTLGAGDTVFVAAGTPPALFPRRVVQPGRPDGRRVVLELDQPVEGARAGAPVFDGGGRVVGFLALELSERRRTPLAIPINRLTEGAEALLAGVLPARAPSEDMGRWREAALAADRVARPALYGLVARGLIAANVVCRSTRCAGRIGVPSFGPRPLGAVGPLVALFLNPAQRPETDDPAFGRTTAEIPDEAWEARPIEGDAGALAVVGHRLREELAKRGTHDLAIWWAPFSIERPKGSRHKSILVVLAGFGGRRSRSIPVAAPRR